MDDLLFIFPIVEICLYKCNLKNRSRNIKHCSELGFCYKISLKKYFSTCWVPIRIFLLHFSKMSEFFNFSFIVFTSISILFTCVVKNNLFF